MRICLLNDSFPPQIDGVANTTKNYAEVIQRRFGDATVVVPHFPGAQDNYPYQVLRYPSFDTTKLYHGYRLGFPFSPEITGNLVDFAPEVIHSHCPIMSTAMARIVQSQVNAPLIFTYHTKFDVDIAKALRFNFLQEPAVKALVNNISACNEVWVVSRGAGENLRSLGYQGDYRVMENGVEFPSGRVSQARQDALSMKYHLPNDGCPVFLFVGRMMWYKNLRLILDALARVKAAGQEFNMVFIGDGQDTAEIKSYAQELGLDKNCLFTGAIRDREELRTWYCRGDLFLFASTYDTNGLVVREAAACSLPSLLVRGSCAAEGITDERNGLLIEENAESMAAVLLKWSKNREGLRQIGENANREIYLSWDDAVARAVERYAIVADNYKAGRYPDPDVPLDEFFDMTGDLLTGLQRAREFRDDMSERFIVKPYRTVKAANKRVLHKIKEKLPTPPWHKK